jgi:hypothetical protein
MDVDVDTLSAALEAAARWTSIITGDLPSVDTSTITLDAANQCACGAPAVIDDLYLCIREGTIDGPCDFDTGTGCVLGTGGFNNIRSGSSIPIAGVVTIDSADLPFLKSNLDIFNDVMTHELGHALGIGTLWETLLLRSGNTYIGTNAVNVWNNEYGCTDSPPLDPSGHWDEACFTEELMSPILLLGATNPITKITVGTLEDIGYTVDYNMAEDSTSNTVNREVCCDARRILRGESTRIHQVGNSSDEGRRNLHQDGILNLGEGDSTKIPPGISFDLYSKARGVAMQQLRSNRENAPEIRDNGGSVYVGDLFLHVYIINDEGKFGSLDFILPMDDEGRNP